MKKRIFIAIHYLEIGGAETSLIGLLRCLDYSLYDVDLMVYSHQGELMKYIPKEVNLLPEIPAYAYIERPMKETLLAGQLGILIGRLVGRIKYEYYLKKANIKSSRSIFQYITNGIEPFLPSLKNLETYHLAISFLTPHNIVLRKVNAQKKICWIHTDYSKISINKELEYPIWKGYDQIISISPDVTKAFLKTFPSLKEKIVEIENILSPQFIHKRANEIPQEKIAKEMSQSSQNALILLSIGRFMEAKNFDNIPTICKILLSLGHSIKWYLIGYGIDETLIRKRIQEEQMENYVIILGKKENPYPYIKRCNIYVQPSRYEGKSITVREAQILHKPVIITNYPTANSQIKHEIDGYIVPLSNKECAEGIGNFIQNKPLQQNIISYLQQNDYGNENEISKIDNFLS